MQCITIARGVVPRVDGMSHIAGAGELCLRSEASIKSKIFDCRPGGVSIEAVGCFSRDVCGNCGSEWGSDVAHG